MQIIKDYNNIYAYKNRLNYHIPKLHVNLCLEGYEKFFEFSLKELDFNLSLDPESTKSYFRKTDKVKIKFDFSLKELENYFFDAQRNKYTLMKSMEEEAKESKENCLIRFSKEDMNYDLKVSSIQITTRVDCYLTLYNYLQNAIPFWMIYTKVKKLKKRLFINAMLSNSKFIIQTSFDADNNDNISKESGGVQW